MSLDDFNTNFNDSESFEDEPTSVLQQIAGKPFTVNKVKSGISKTGNAYCIVWTVKEYTAGVATDETGQDGKTIYKSEQVSKFFVTVREPKQFFSDPLNMEKINSGTPCGPMTIAMIPFTAEQIKENAKLKGKSHYIVKAV